MEFFKKHKVALMVSAIVVAVIVIFMATGGNKIFADGGSNADAVVNCNKENVLGHGGSVDNPPECEEEEEPNMVLLPVVQPEEEEEVVEQVVGAMGEWVMVSQDSDTKCIEAKAKGQLRAAADYLVNDESKDPQDNFDEPKEIEAMSEGCIRITTIVEARGFAEVK